MTGNSSMVQVRTQVVAEAGREVPPVDQLSGSGAGHDG